MLAALLALTLAAAPVSGPSTGAATPAANGPVSKDRSTGAAKAPSKGTSAAAKDAKEGDPGDEVVLAARDMVARAKLDKYGDPPVAERVHKAGLDAAALVQLLDELAALCPATGACTRLSSEPAVRHLLDALGAVGSRADAPVLLRLDARGFWAAERALESILTREMASASATAKCAPPSAQEIARARADLDGFVALRHLGGRRVAEALTAAETDDLAYFYAAVAGGGPEVGAAEELASTSSRAAAAQGPDPEAQRLEETITRAKAAGDVDAIATASRAYLSRLGFPGPIDVDLERTWAWGGARFSYVLRDLALASELRGQPILADQLYRRANPGGGMCGTSVSTRWAEQVRGAIRSSEQRGECRLAVAERLLDIDGPSRSWSNAAPGEDYGPSRLAAAGFDVPRLYRGALLTLHRDRELADLRTILGQAPAPLRDRALARLERRGAEAWAARVYAIEGLADTSGRAGTQALLALLQVADPEVQPRILRSIGDLAARPATDPCDPDAFGISGLSFSSQWERQVSALGDRCETSLRLPEAAALARALSPWIRSTNPEIREAAAGALGKIGHRAALPALQGLRRDPHQPADTLRCDDGKCHRFYPVREAAVEAIASIKNLSADDDAWLTAAPLDRLPTGL